jgi:recombination protein RecT
MAVSAARETDKKSGALKLGSIDPEIIAEKVIACHHLGLEIGDQASLVPYGSDLQLIVGPRGLIALMYRSGFIKSVEARSVFDGDEFDYSLGSKKFIHHKKATSGRRVATISHAYFVAETTTEGTVQEVLTFEDIEYYRSFSKAKTGPWVDNFEGMCRKTAIKRGAEFIPRSALLSAALREDDHGGYEVPEEIMRAARTRMVEQVATQETGEVIEPAQTDGVVGASA